jgi:outer membrane protein TolC
MRQGAVILLVCLLTWGVFCTDGAAAKPIKRIAFVLDGPEMYSKGLVNLFQHELWQLLVGDFQVQFPEDLRLEADYTADGVRAELQQVTRRGDVDLVVALGFLASREACLMAPVEMPLIAAMVLDHDIQGVPYRQGTSGVKNLTYVEIPDTFEEDLTTLAELAPFDRLALLGGRSLFAALPGVEADLEFKMPYSEAQMRVVAAGPTVTATLAALPEEVDAVYLLPIPELTLDDHEALLEALALKGLPVFSLIGHRLVHMGALAGLNQVDLTKRLARRVALNARKILAGQPAADLPVAISRQAQLMVNIQTARIIGVYPSFTALTDAILIKVEEDPTVRELNLLEVIDEAIVVNLALRATGRSAAAGEGSVDQVRARLLPQVSAQATATQIDADRGESTGAPAERSATLALNLSQVIWSDEAWANLSVEKMGQLRRDLEWEQARLDVALEAAQAYLNVLLAQTQQGIQVANLKLSRSNLERARMRRDLGAASSAEVYRLESKIARERADLMAAATQRKIAEMALNRVLAYPLEQPFKLAEVALDEQVSLLLSPNIGRYADNVPGLGRLKQFMVDKGLRAATELLQIDADIAVQKRLLLATKRSYYSPEVTLSGQTSQLLAEGGQGADLDLPGAPDDTDWNLSLNLSLPLWEGGARPAETKAYRETLKALRLTRRVTAQQVEQRIRNAVHQSVSSFTSIDLLKQAAEASKKNFDLVAGAYGRGAVQLIDLLDAQTTYLQAEQNAANASHQFLLDLMELERALGRFTFFAPPAERAAWITALEAYFKSNEEK